MDRFMTRMTCHPHLQSLSNYDFGDKIKVKPFFFLEIASISRENSKFRNEIEVKTFFFLRLPRFREKIANSETKLNFFLEITTTENGRIEFLALQKLNV